MIDKKLDAPERKGRTASLWVEYHKIERNIKSFIRSDRLSDWQGHNRCVASMLNAFAAAGHSKYAKGARLQIELERF